MNIYQYYSRKCESDVEITFNRTGFLKRVEILHEIEVAKDIDLNIPVHKEAFLASAKLHGLKVKEIMREPPFDEFWEKYNHKECGRTKAEQSWKQLTRIEKLEAVEFIPIYNSKLKASQVKKKYATTYLTNKVWII